MKYMGSKARFKQEILPIILKNIPETSWYVEPFVGGCNVIDACKFEKRIGSDSNYYLIEMWKKLIGGWIPQRVTKEQYNKIKENKDDFDPSLVGFVGFACSYSGKWFGGLADKVKTKIGTIRDYQDEAIRNILKQVPNLRGVEFVCSDYMELDLPMDSVIYCDPPYRNTTRYDGTQDFNSDEFWDWVRNKSQRVFVSEYTAPSDFVCVWSKEAKSSLSANGMVGGNKNSVERLFIHERSLL